MAEYVAFLFEIEHIFDALNVRKAPYLRKNHVNTVLSLNGGEGN